MPRGGGCSVRIQGRIIFAIVLALAILSIVASCEVKAHAYSTPPTKPMSVLCQRLTDNTVNIEPFVEYLSGMQSSKAKAVASLDERIKVLTHSHSGNYIIERFIIQERDGLIHARKLFLVGKITLGNARAYITSNLTPACRTGAQA